VVPLGLFVSLISLQNTEGGSLDFGDNIGYLGIIETEPFAFFQVRKGESVVHVWLQSVHGKEDIIVCDRLRLSRSQLTRIVKQYRVSPGLWSNESIDRD
jgi:hypothetical protein